MPEIKMEFPGLIVVEQLSDKGRSNLAVSVPLVKQITDQAARGVVTKDGTWAQNPANWKIRKLGEGRYQVTHNWGYFNISLSVTLVQSPGVIKIAESNLTAFTVETYLDKQLTDMPFAFTLTKVISP